MQEPEQKSEGGMPVSLAAGVMMVLGAALLGHAWLSSGVNSAAPRNPGRASPTGPERPGPSDEPGAEWSAAVVGVPRPVTQRVMAEAKRLSATPSEVRLAALGPLAQGEAEAALARCLDDDFSHEAPPDRHPHGSGGAPRYHDLGFIVPSQLDGPSRQKVQAMVDGGPACALVVTSKGPVVLRKMVAYPAGGSDAVRGVARRLLALAAVRQLAEQTLPAAMAANGFTPPVSARSAVPEGMVAINGGVYWIGSTEEQIDERLRVFARYTATFVPRHDGRRQFEDQVRRPVRLEGFWLDRREVTVGRYGRFCQDSGYRAGPCAGEKASKPGPSDELPVVKVNLADAIAFCAFYRMRLPSAHEWEAAARGKAGRRFPWGASFPDRTRANFCDRRCTRPWAHPDIDDGHAGVAPVGSYPAGATPEGALDLSGNVREWTSTLQPDGRVLVKGGGFHNAVDDMLPADVRANRWQDRLPDVGFRCARDRDGDR